MVLCVLVFSVVQCGLSFSASWLLTLLLDTSHHPVPSLLGVIIPARQLTASGLLLPISLVKVAQERLACFQDNRRPWYKGYGTILDKEQDVKIDKRKRCRVFSVVRYSIWNW